MENKTQNQPVPASKKSSGLLQKAKSFTVKRKFSLQIIALTLLFCITGIISFTRASNAAAISYAAAKETAADETEQAFYDLAFNWAEQQNHVSQTVDISIDSIREKANLQVLVVRDTAYMIYDKNDNDDGITCWYKVPGSCIFTVNLQSAEFVVDSNHRHVLVRVLAPQLTGDCNIDYEHVERLLYVNEGGNDSIATGIHLTESQIREASLLIESQSKGDPEIMDSAKKSATKLISHLVRAVNPDVEELTVDVEFY